MTFTLKYRENGALLPFFQGQFSFLTMSGKIITIDPEIAKEARDQADFLLAELRARNPGYKFSKELLEGTYSTLYGVKIAGKKVKIK